ncbi:MAG: hypothetical protein Q4Q20_05835 [Methanocorpusculum sp.]|nr:hypothetical protein [Methanocorpusculum sp.]
MTDKRTLTVSATINLGNYENLRIEVSDLAESAEEADTLRHFLATVLDGYGNNSASARAAIQKYKEHILEDGAESVPANSDTDSASDLFLEDAEMSFLSQDTASGTAVEEESESAERDAEYEDLSYCSAASGEKPVQKPDFIPDPVSEFKPVSIPVPMPEPVSAGKPEPESYNLPPAPLVEEKNSEEYICSKCGARVNKLQRDVSMLFNHKILCKDCMK